MVIVVGALIVQTDEVIAVHLKGIVSRFDPVAEVLIAKALEILQRLRVQAGLVDVLRMADIVIAGDDEHLDGIRDLLRRDLKVFFQRRVIAVVGQVTEDRDRVRVKPEHVLIAVFQRELADRKAAVDVDVRNDRDLQPQFIPGLRAAPAGKRNERENHGQYGRQKAPEDHLYIFHTNTSRGLMLLFYHTNRTEV